MRNKHCDMVGFLVEQGLVTDPSEIIKGMMWGWMPTLSLAQSLAKKSQVYNTVLLIVAARNDRDDLLEELLSKGGEIHPTHAKQLLILALRIGNVRVVEHLLARGTVPGHQELAVAAADGNEQMVRLLLTKFVDEVDAAGWKAMQVGYSYLGELGDYHLSRFVDSFKGLATTRTRALVQSARRGHEDLVQLLIAHNPEKHTIGPWIALVCAAQAGHGGVVRLLWEHAGLRDRYRHTAHWAPSGDEIVQYLSYLPHFKDGADQYLDHGGLPYRNKHCSNSPRNCNLTDLWKLRDQWYDMARDAHGEYDRYPEALRAARDERENMDIVWCYERALAEAATYNHHSVARLLLTDFDEEEISMWIGNSERKRPVVCASRKGNVDMVRLLLEGSTVRNQEYYCEALCAAAEACHETVMRVLLEFGANANGQAGVRPLCVAARSNCRAIVHLLLEYGADINAEGADGQTALTERASDGDGAMVRLLLEAGADPNRPNKQGNTALALATEQGYNYIVQLLVAKGAREQCD